MQVSVRVCVCSYSVCEYRLIHVWIVIFNILCTSCRALASSISLLLLWPLAIILQHSTILVYSINCYPSLIEYCSLFSVVPKCIPILLLVIYNFIIYFTLNHDISAVQQSLHEKYSAANGEKEPREWRRDTRMTTEEKSNRFVSDGWWVYFIILIPHSQSHKWLYDCNWIRNKERHN